MITSDEIYQALVESIGETVEAFQKQPYRYLYESDLQADLFANSRKYLPHTINIKGTGQPSDSYDISIVHTEYASRIDLVCLDPVASQFVEPKAHKGIDTYIYGLPVLVGVEIKYKKLGDKFGIEGCFSDLEKLDSLKKKKQCQIAIVLGFIQNEKDVDSFFDNCTDEWERKEVSLHSPLGSINIFSPLRRWVVEPAK